MRWRFAVVFVVVAKHHCSLSHFDFGGDGGDDCDNIPETIMLSVRTTSDGDGSLHLRVLIPAMLEKLSLRLLNNVNMNDSFAQ